MQNTGDTFSDIPSSFWDLSAINITGDKITFDTYKDSKAILVVNVASECGYTPNYKYLT
jgi:glutathione peroxidase-family protein